MIYQTQQVKFHNRQVGKLTLSPCSARSLMATEILLKFSCFSNESTMLSNACTILQSENINEHVSMYVSLLAYGYSKF